jgi:hypothetical protein
MPWKAHTPHDGETTEHATRKEAQHEARRRQGYENGRIPGQRWLVSTFRCAGVFCHVWEDADSHDRGLNAVVWDDSNKLVAAEILPNDYGIAL